MKASDFSHKYFRIVSFIKLARPTACLLEQKLHITASFHLIGGMNSVTPWLKSCLRKELKGHSKKITVAHIFHTQVFAYTQTFKSMLIDFPEKHISQYAQYIYSYLPFTRQRYKSFKSSCSVSLLCRMPLSNQLDCLFATHTDLQCMQGLCIELYTWQKLHRLTATC